MQGAERSNHYFMNVKDIINMAFGELDGNVVNFRLVRIVLYLLARQLRILERRVEVSVPIGVMESASSFSVTEVKVHAISKKSSKKESKLAKHSVEGVHEQSSKSRYKGGEKRDSRDDKEGSGGVGGRGEETHRRGVESKGGREEIGGTEAKKGKGDKEHKEIRDHGREGKESKERSDGKSGRETKESSQSTKKSVDDQSSLSSSSRESYKKDDQETRKTKDREGKSVKESKVSKAGKDSRIDKQIKGGKHKDGTEYKENTDSSDEDKTKVDMGSKADKRSKDQEAKTIKETKAGKDIKGGKDSKDIKEGRGGEEEKEGKRGKGIKEIKKGGEDEEDKEGKRGKGMKEIKKGGEDEEGKESKRGKEHKEGKAGKEDKESKEDKDSKESKERKELKHGKERRELKEGKEDERDKERREGRADQERKEAKSGKESKSAKSGKERRPGDKQKPADYQRSSELLRRERELRVIHQRADSYEQPDESPTPMASVDEMETQYEKLLVVESVSSEDRSLRGTHTPRLSAVTKEEFVQLANVVDGLCTRFKIDNYEDAKLMEDLHKRTSYTEAMAAMQLSARLEATEKLLGRMVTAIGTIARVTPGIRLDDETKAILETYGGIGAEKVDKSPSRIAHKKASPKKVKGSKPSQMEVAEETPVLQISEESVKMIEEPVKAPEPPKKVEPEGLKHDCVTYMDLDSELRKLSNEMMKQVTTITSRNVQTADRAFKIASSLEGKLDSSLDVGPRMVILESQVATYADQINALDTGLTSQMINYQEQLTQMQHELEVGLEAMAEALANAQGADTLAVAELNSNFISLQTEQENMNWQQRDLQESHNLLANDLASLWKQIELLRETKSDRDEVTDALRDKAGIKDLNGLVSLEQFDAVRGDLEKRIASAYDKFNNQEIIWQKAIDDLLRELGEKADLIQLYGLKDEINKYLTAMKKRMKVIADIVGEPKAAIVNKKLFRDTVCISCSSPATMDVEEPNMVPALPKFPDKAKSDAGKPEDKSQMKGDGDHKKCYPGLPIPHPRHPRAHICTRYCGGSHTLIPGGPPKVPPSTIITPLAREVTMEPGDDGKMYQVEKTPCLPCNMPLKSEDVPCGTTPVIANSTYGDTIEIPATIQPSDAHQPRETEEFARPSTASSASMLNTETETPPAIDAVF